MWQLQIYSRSIERAISNIRLCRLSSPFNSVPSIVLLCQACQHADLLLFCLIHCNDSVYKESREATHIHNVHFHPASKLAAESIDGNKTVVCLFLKRQTNLHTFKPIGWSAAGRGEKQRLCLDTAHKSGVFTLIKPMTKLPINHKCCVCKFHEQQREKNIFSLPTQCYSRRIGIRFDMLWNCLIDLRWWRWCILQWKYWSFWLCHCHNMSHILYAIPPLRLLTQTLTHINLLLFANLTENITRFFWKGFSKLLFICVEISS